MHTIWRLLPQFLILSIAVLTFQKEATTHYHYWSAYYKIEAQEFAGKRYVVNVNGLPQQIIESVEQRKKVKPFYFLPYQHSLSPAGLDRVLVIGAGTGGDVAIALKQGAKQVDAVEIDPVLYQLAQKFNPNQPYRDPRVHVYINDGRAFLQQTTNNYDMIIFALTDSLMLVPGQSSIRLENYLYTLEGLLVASQRLKPNGVFTIYNFYAVPWLVDRLANTLSIIYKHEPCIDTYSPENNWATVLTISQNAHVLQCPRLWKSSRNQYQTPSTDDHPFIYLQDPSLPFIYVSTILLIAFTLICLIKLTKVSYHSIRNYFDLLLMGAAFLLLETKNIINFALFFGTTWFVNALVFIGIIFTVYLAVEITGRLKLPPRWVLYVALMISLISSWFVPNDYLLLFPITLRFLTATALAFTPILIANIIFADRFRHTEQATDAFGANMIGAVFGGLLEYLSLIMGYHHLLILIIFLYLTAIITMIINEKRLAQF